MANSTFAGIDFSQYQKWEKIVAPTGAVYYVVPGTGYVYDPFLSAAKGRPVLWTNPKPTVDEKEQAEAEKKELMDQQKYVSSPTGQLVPVVGAALGTVGGAYAINKFIGPSSTTETPAPTTTTPEVNQTPPTTSAQAFNAGAGLDPNVPIGQNADGSYIYPPESSGGGGSGGGGGGGDQPPSNTMSNLGRGIQGAAGAYNFYSGLKEGGVPGYGQAAGGALQMYGAYSGNPTYGTVASGVMQGAGLYGDATSGQYSDEELAQQAQKRAGLVVGDAFTFGGASLGANLLLKTPFGQKADALYNKIDAKLNPMTPIVGKVIGALGLNNGNKSRMEQERLTALKERGIMVPDEIIANPGILPGSKDMSLEERLKYAEETGLSNADFERTRDESYLRPQDIVRSAAFFEKYPDWHNKSDEERLAIADQALKARAVREHHGSVDIDWDLVGAGPPQNTPQLQGEVPPGMVTPPNARMAFLNSTKPQQTPFAGLPPGVQQGQVQPMQRPTFPQQQGQYPMGGSFAAPYNAAAQNPVGDQRAPLISLNQNSGYPSAQSIDPGRIPGNIEVNTTKPPDTKNVPKRSITRSPGIGLDGRPIDYDNVGKQLAARMNRRRR